MYDSGATSGASTTSVNDGEWHQLIGIYDATTNHTASIAVDGAIESSQPRANINGTAAPFIVGGLESSGGAPINAFTGLIDDVQLYNHALSASEVDFLFRNPGVAIPEPASIGILLLGYAGLIARKRR